MRPSISGLRLASGLLAVWVLCSIGCGGGDDDSGSAGGPRLEWDQWADSLQQLQALSFTLYLDGVGRPLTGTLCRAMTGATGYVCSGSLPRLGPGSHVIQLTSVLNEIESAQSEPLVVAGNSTGLTAVQQPARQPDSSGRAHPTAACLAGNPDECYELTPIATGLAGVSAMSPAPDGRLFFVEDGVRVRVVMDSVLITEPVLTLANSEARIVDIAVDRWSFDETRSVFVAWTETSFGATQLSVTRYREVANTLGDGVTILTGLGVPPETPASIALDRDGLLYLALPANDDPTSARAGSGAVLRVTRDGLVPPTNPLGLPTIAAGFSRPASLSPDPSQPRVWLAGRNPDYPYAIVLISPSSEEVQAARVIAYVPSDDSVSLVVMPGRLREDPPALFLVAQGRLAKASWSDDRRLTSFATLDLGEDWRLTRAAPRIGGGLYVASETSIAALIQQ